MGDPANVILAWSGGAYDTVNDRLLVWGGGHGDYGGNEIYAFSIRSLSWARIWGPSPLDMIAAAGASGSCVSAYLDGNPVSRHTYGGLEFLPARNSLAIVGGSMFECGGGARDLWLFNLGTGAWARKADPPYLHELGNAIAYDSATGHIFLSDPSGYYLHEYDPTQDLWILRSNQGGGYDKTAVIDTKRRRLVLVGHGEVYMYDLTTGSTFTRQGVITSGPQDIVNGKAPGLAYDPVSDRIVGWNGGANVFTLDPATWVWTQRSPAPTNTVTPTGVPAAGTYGRFRYIPSKNAYIVVNSVDEDVYIYKLSSGTGAPPDSVAPSAPSDLRTR